MVVLPHGRGLDLPEYATEGSAGLDLLAACGPQGMTVAPLKRILVPTGIAIALPRGFEAQVRPRSGLAIRHGITVLNSPGTVDSDYRGEIKVILINLGEREFRVERGMRIAQLVIAAVDRLEWEPVEKLPDTVRGAGGFGHTGF